MQVDTKKQLKDLKGNTIGELGDALAGLLLDARTQKGNPFEPYKSYVLAKKISENEQLEIDDADIKNFVKLINSSKQFTSPLILGQLLEVLEGKEA